MAAVKVLKGKPHLHWEYDEEADVLYISVGEPRKAEGIDIGEGVIVRYDEDRKEVVGLTILGLRSRVTSRIAGEGAGKYGIPEEFLQQSWEHQRKAGGPVLTREEWDKLVLEAYRELVMRAETASYDNLPITYGDLGSKIGLFPLSDWFYLKIGWIVGACSEYEHQHGRPMISAMVINKETKQPGRGFWRLSGIPPHLRKEVKYGYGDATPEKLDEDRDRFWIAELQRISRYWKGQGSHP